MNEKGKAKKLGVHMTQVEQIEAKGREGKEALLLMSNCINFILK